MDLTQYRQMPYEREWFMREDAGRRYYVVRLKDIPAVAGDGLTRDEAVEDLREAFDEFVLAWIESGREVPSPSRAFTAPSARAARPAKEWPSIVSPAADERTPSPSWAASAELFSSLVLVQKSTRKASVDPNVSNTAVAV